MEILFFGDRRILWGGGKIELSGNAGRSETEPYIIHYYNRARNTISVTFIVYSKGMYGNISQIN